MSSKPVSKPAASKAAPNKPKTVRMRVRATALGFYNNKRRRPGDVFVIEGELIPGKPDGDPTRVKAFSDAWMELAETATKPAEPAADVETDAEETDDAGDQTDSVI